MRHALISGGSGFIGRKLITRLRDDGVCVTTLIHDEALRTCFEGMDIEVVYCPLDKVNTEALTPGAYDVFYHFAWDGVSTSDKNEYEKQFKNVEMSLNACRIAAVLQCNKMVFPGSVSQYAYANTPVDGSGRPSPADAYAVAKVSAQFACSLFCRQNNIDFIWLLIPSIYGPGRHDDNVITYTIHSLLKGIRPSYTKLEQVWDYLYIDDLIEALVLAGEHGVRDRVYAIGSGDKRTLAEFVYIIRNIINPAAELGIGEVPYKSKRVDNSIVDITQFSKDTGFRPSMPFEEGILKTIDYYRTHI